MRAALGSLLGSIKCRSLLFFAGGAALVALPVIFFVIYYVGQEQPVYYWDYYAWFSLYQTYGEKAASGQMSWFYHWVVTVFAANYNSTSIVPLIPFYFLLGETRTAYVLGIVLLYLLPALYLMGRVCVEALGLSKSDKTSLFFVYVSALFLARLVISFAWYARCRRAYSLSFGAIMHIQNMEEWRLCSA